jgi:septal ring factor EnvC (AmiA/AmiB activator)
MKKLLFILLSFLFLLSCNNTPEEKIKKSFYFQRISRYHSKIKVKSVKIYDTIYIDEVSDKIDEVEKEIKNVEKEIKKFNLYRDSILKLTIDDLEKRQILQDKFEKKRILDREIDHLSRKEMHISNVDFQRDNYISAYYVEIITNRDTMYFAVSPLTYTIICPLFMLE